MPTPHQPYTIHPVDLADAPAIMATGSAAFQHDPLRLATFPATLVDAAKRSEEEEWRLRRFEKRIATPGAVIHKIVADDGVTVAGFSGWSAPAKDGDEAGDQTDAANPTGEVPGCVNAELFEEQLRLMKEMKQKVLGARRDYWYLNSLATHPDHQGKGVGAALVRWGIEQGEKDGLPVYLEATPSGFPLYKKLGFEVVDWVDMSKWTLDGRSYKLAVMLKMPGSGAKP